MKNSLSRRLFQKYGLPPRGYQWGATSFLPTQGMWKPSACSRRNLEFTRVSGIFLQICTCVFGRKNEYKTNLTTVV